MFLILWLISTYCSVVGLNFDFLVLNLTKHSSYLIYNTGLFFSPFIQRQYHEKYGDKEVCSFAFFQSFRCYDSFSLDCSMYQK
jgi:hypothetical protein